MSDWAAQEAALFGGGAPPRAAPRSEAAARRQFVGDVSGDELLSAAAVLAASDAATVAALFPGQPHAANKRGCYVVRLCCFGLWRLVVVDDSLPTLRGRPCFAGVDGALWPALVEKAAAKVYGGYELLSGGHVRSALALLTGWPCGDHSLDLHDAQGGSVEDKRDVLWLTLLSLVEARAVCCASARTDAARLNAVGLNQRHAYSVVDVVELTDLGGTVSRLVRLRDPHGDALQRSWAGDWSAADLARRPRELGDALRSRGAPDPSTQWLSFADLERYFSRVSFCEDRSAWAGDLRAAARAGFSVAAAGAPCLALRSRARAPAAVCLERRADGPDACVLVLRASRRALRRGRCGADAVTGVHAVASAAVAGGAATALGTWVGGGDDDLVHVVAPLCLAPSAVDVNLAVLSRDALDAAPAVLEPAALAAALRQLARGDDNPRYFHGLRLSAAKCGLATLLVASNANASDTATRTQTTEEPSSKASWRSSLWPPSPRIEDRSRRSSQTARAAASSAASSS
ncbi:calcium-dependent cysteine-type endopeptidase [Aureococcus anophagefferens]|nr:calcium-dependent cysteine-type endopeptidase [Aureococcus anophagefferens]